MFEMAKDEILESQTYEIMAGYYSPVSSHYKKQGLAPAEHRVRMCELAVEHTSTWLMVDPWEAGQPEYQRTAVVLDHFDEELNGVLGGLTMKNGKKRKYKVMLLAGGDLIESFGEPGVWSEPDVRFMRVEERLPADADSCTSFSAGLAVSLSSGQDRTSGRSSSHTTSCITTGKSSSTRCVSRALSLTKQTQCHRYQTAYL